MKVLLLSRYGQLGASSRQRAFQYIPYLKDHCVDVTVAPLLGDDYLQTLYTAHSKAWSFIIASYARRIITLLTSRQFDLLWIEKELLPYCPSWLEALLAMLKIPYVVDYDDATFHIYNQNANPIVRGLLGKKIAHVMRYASVVVVGNDYLGDYARKSGASHIEYLPTVIDLDRYPSTPHTASDIFTIGWIGSPSTTKYVAQLHAPLLEFCQQRSAKILLIGAEPIELPGVPLEIRPWSETTEIADLLGCDVGIMPLLNTPWEQGKCGYKLVQYMACGLPTIASPVGINQQIVEHGVTGFLASTPADWLNAFLALQSDSALRRKMGEAGRVKVETYYNLEVTAPKLLSILTRANQ